MPPPQTQTAYCEARNLSDGMVLSPAVEGSGDHRSRTWGQVRRHVRLDRDRLWFFDPLVGVDTGGGLRAREYVGLWGAVVLGPVSSGGRGVQVRDR